MDRRSTPEARSDIREMFSRIAPRYDLLNHALSFNIDRSWRRTLVRKAGIRPGDTVLDVCAGTCDIPLVIAGRHGNASVVAADFSHAMLLRARDKLEKKGAGARIHLLEADAMRLPFADGSFDVVTIGFGLRNLPDRARGVLEMARLLKPGGRLLVLEFKPPGRGLWSRPYRWYLRRIVPRVGGWMSKSSESYAYLSESVDGFLEPGMVCGLLTMAGLSDIKMWSLTGGIAVVYRGERQND